MRVLLSYIRGDTIFLPYGNVVPLWFFCPWLSSCVLCCKSGGARYFLGLEQKCWDFENFYFLAELGAGVAFVLRVRRNLYGRVSYFRQLY